MCLNERTNCRWRLFVLRPSSFVLRPSSFVLRPSSFVIRPSSFVLRPSSFVLRPSSFVLPSSFLRPSFVRRHLSFVVHHLPFVTRARAVVAVRYSLFATSFLFVGPSPFVSPLVARRSFVIRNSLNRCRRCLLFAIRCRRRCEFLGVVVLVRCRRYCCCNGVRAVVTVVATVRESTFVQLFLLFAAQCWRSCGTCCSSFIDFKICAFSKFSEVVYLCTPLCLSNRTSCEGATFPSPSLPIHSPSVSVTSTAARRYRCRYRYIPWIG